MATIDSGTETLFSDDSPCGDAERSPSVCFGYEPGVGFAPPNIQPYSGVLEKGKVVIRPIAFKPPTMSQGGRFGLAGERYGSTPILTRPGSRLTLYGSSNDIHRHHQAYSMTNYSLDRSKLRSSAMISSSSPPLATGSLSSILPLRESGGSKLFSYDSLESVRKSRLTVSGSNEGSLVDLTPSPSDSGVSELEAALRDRDSELAYLRQTMEHNEQVIFRVYQEKEKVWERELKRLKNVQESRLRTSAQKVLKLEQMLMMQTYQQQQEKKRLAGDAQRSSLQCERLLQEVAVLRDRLEETEWGLCEKTGEISLLKTQLKELQNDHLHKLQLRETKTLLEERDKQLEELRASSSSKDEQIHALREELARLTASEVPRPTEEDLEVEKLNLGDGEVERLRDVLAEKSRQFEDERLTWAQEKEKVLKYQRQLQLNYVQMFRRARELEVELQRKKEEEDSSH